MAVGTHTSIRAGTQWAFKILGLVFGLAYFIASVTKIFVDEADFRKKFWPPTGSVLKKGGSVTMLFLTMLPELFQWALSIYVILAVQWNDEQGYNVLKLIVQAGWLLVPVLQLMVFGGCCA